jgi:hypothetical protein
MKFRGKLPPWAILAVFLVFGLALIFIPHFFEWRWDYGIVPEIGVALVVASILGFTIDRWLKAEIRRDVFLASIGHVLLPEFRDEVSRIVGYVLICERPLCIDERHDKARVRKGAITNGEVDAFFDEIARPLGDQHLDDDLGIARAERR